MAASTRRTGTEGSKTRAVLLDATAHLMRAEGYAAVSSRRVASAAGVTGALVHYYFPTLDDLFLAVFRRGAEQNLERHERALGEAQPLRALWGFSLDPAGTALFVEFIALANHRKAIKREIAAYSKRFRKLQVELLTDRLREYGIDPDEVPTEVVLSLIGAISRSIVMEGGMGIDNGHAEMLAFVERWLTRYEGEPAAPKRPTARRRPAKKATKAISDR
jgi:AcrR family transcriptional regulator